MVENEVSIIDDKLVVGDKILAIFVYDPDAEHSEYDSGCYLQPIKCVWVTEHYFTHQAGNFYLQTFYKDTKKPTRGKLWSHEQYEQFVNENIEDFL